MLILNKTHFIKIFTLIAFFTIFLNSTNKVFAGCDGGGVNCCTDLTVSRCSNTGVICSDKFQCGGADCVETTTTSCTWMQCSSSIPPSSCSSNRFYCNGTPHFCSWVPVCGDGICDNPGNPCQCLADCSAYVTVSGWSACSASCGGGTQTKTNSCGQVVASQACNTQSCTWCGDGSCNGGETCSSCYNDCKGGNYWPGTCSVSCGIGIEYEKNSCGNTGASRSCTRGSWSAYSACTKSCNSGTKTRSWSCSPSPGIASPQTLSCNTQDCDPEICDDNGSCTGLETPANCAQDCPNPASAWWQVRGGMIGAQNDDANISITAISPNGEDIVIKNNMPDAADCNEGTSCILAISATDLDETTETDGFPIMGPATGGIETNGFTTQRTDNISATNTKKTRYEERYQYFYRNSTLGLNPTDDFSGSAGDASKPGVSGEYFSAGDLTITNNWNITDGEQYTIFIDGNLTLNGDTTDQLITTDSGGFIAFIVSGDIIIQESLGNSTLTDLTPNLEGIFIADGIIDIQTRGSNADDRFVGEGTFVAWSGFDFNRSLDPGQNSNKPVETFIYRPDFLLSIPTTMTTPVRVWQETN